MTVHHTLLTADEERALSIRVLAGDVAARNELVRHNHGLVVSIAKHFQGRGLDMDDLIGEGILGLIRAADDYDGTLGTRFNTYATHWIKSSIRRGIADRNTALPLRIPAWAYCWMARRRQVEAALSHDPRNPPDPAVVSALAMPTLRPGLRECVEAAAKIQRTAQEPDVAFGGGPLAWIAVAAPTEPGHDMDAAAERKRIHAAIATLDERSRMVLTLRFGLDGGGVRKLNEIGGRLGVSRQRVDQIEREAIEFMKEVLGDVRTD